MVRSFFFCAVPCYTQHMKRLVIIVVLVIVFAVSAFAGYNRRAENPDPNHTHADFAVWINGVQFDFAQDKYMSHVPTAAHPSSLLFVPRAFAHADEPEGGSGAALSGREYLHLHDGNGHVIHRHQPGLGFGDFLTSLGFTFTGACLMTDVDVETCNTDSSKWQFFVNGEEKIPVPLNYVFADEDHLLLTYGADSADIKKELMLLTNDACLYSKTCPGRGAPPAENCIADPTVPCVAQ